MIKTIILNILKNIRNTFLAVLPIKLFVSMINLASHLFFIEEKMQSINVLKHFLRNKLFQENNKKPF